MSVSEVMHPALTLYKRASLREAADRMIQNHYHRLVGVDQNDPQESRLGALSSFELVAEMARPDLVWEREAPA